jgi:hypothetical protein
VAIIDTLKLARALHDKGGENTDICILGGQAARTI